MAYGAPVTTYDPTNVMGRRIVAWFIDVFLPTVAAVLIGYIVFISAATKVPGSSTDSCTLIEFSQPDAVCLQVGNDAYVGTTDDRRNAFAVGGFVYLLGAVNLFVVQGLTGASIGKHVLGLRVVRADGSLVTFGPNAVRTLLLVVDQFFCALVGLITAFATHPHRRVGDMAAGTYVVAKEAVGTPIAAQMGVSSYPPPWTPPSPAWGPPPAAGTPTWGTPAPGWGTPPAGSPPPASTTPTTPTWGTPAASPPSTAPKWGTPEASPPAATDPQTATPSADAPGWGAPTPVQSPAPEATAPQASPPPPKREPQWDAQRNAWVYWEPETNRWLQHDAATGQWGPLR